MHGALYVKNRKYINLRVLMLMTYLALQIGLIAQTSPVRWIGLSNAHEEGSSLIADGFGAAGRSEQMIATGAGSFQFTVFAQNHQAVAGLSQGLVATSRAEMPFAINLNGVSSAEVWEGGTYRGETTYAVGDVFSLAVQPGSVKYLKNDTVFFTTNTVVSYPLSLSALPVKPVPGSRISNAAITVEGPLAFRVTPTGSNVTITPSSPQNVTPGQTASFTVLADAGYTLATVSGSAPVGSFTGNVYTTGPITADCNVVFSASLHSNTPNISAVWANDGGDKVVREETRGTLNPLGVRNRLWDGTVVHQFGAKNEVVSINFVIEAANTAAASLKVSLSDLTGPRGSVIRSAPRPTNALFNWTETECELFLVRYLQIKGLSAFGYGLYAGSETQIPEKLRLPLVNGNYTGGWNDRPNHDKFYPDIAVPIELASTFNIASGNNQSVWVDIYIPKTAAPGLYTGSFSLFQNGSMLRQIPVALSVRNFELPDVPSSKTMLFTEYGDISRRYTDQAFPNPGSAQDALTLQVLNHQRLVAHRHKISLIGDDGQSQPLDQPNADYLPVLSGAAFTASYGYAGPGAGVGNDVYSIGTYGNWTASWGTSQSEILKRTNQWETWFQGNFPAIERFLYLSDESADFAQTELWAGWMKRNPGIGKNLPSMATVSAPVAAAQIPSLTIPTSTFGSGTTAVWQDAVDTIHATPGRKYYMYNGKRPGEGSFSTECEGVDLREIPWGQYKMGVARWFFWEATYYNDVQSGQGNTDVFNQAKTFGVGQTANPSYGLQGGNASNGDGVLFYPGTDHIFPGSSYGIKGPIASLRLKHWRRGIQDVDYLTLAAARNAPAVAALVQQMVPKAMWELPITDPGDPTYYSGVAPSWSMNPDHWEATRETLADIIEGSAAAGNEPQLALVRTPTGVVAIWDAAAKGWTLQQSTELSSWSNIGSPISGCGSYTYTGNAKKLFMRLAKSAP